MPGRAGSELQRVDDLEIGQDLEFQRREWTIQRIGWAAMALIALAALLGLFGSGPLSHATAGQEGDPLRLAYARLDRKRSPSDLRLEIAAGTAQEGQVRLWLDRAYLAGLELQQILPEPDQAQASGDRMVYVFQVGDPNQATEVIFQVEHNTFGLKTGRVGLVDGPGLEFRQLVYP